MISEMSAHCLSSFHIAIKMTDDKTALGYIVKQAEAKNELEVNKSSIHNVLGA